MDKNNKCTKRGEMGIKAKYLRIYFQLFLELKKSKEDDDMNENMNENVWKIGLRWQKIMDINGLKRHYNLNKLNVLNTAGKLFILVVWQWGKKTIVK